MLAVYGIGLPAFVLHKMLQPLFYAREDSRSPFRYALVSMVVNLGIAIGLMPFIGFVAAALATTVAGWVMVWQLWRGSRKMGAAAQLDERFRKRLPRILLAAVAMGVVLWFSTLSLGPMLGTAGWRGIGLGLLVSVGMISYFAVAAVFWARSMFPI